VCNNHRQILAFLDIKNDGVHLVCGGLGSPKNIFGKIQMPMAINIKNPCAGTAFFMQG
jgi:hypothetical protein